MSTLTHSYSALKLYENCPLRYYRQRIAKDVKDQAGEASLYGERVHKQLEDRLKPVEPVVLPDDIAHYEALCRSIELMAKGGSLHVEQELTLSENLTPTGWWDADAWMRSKLDVLVITPSGKTAIVCDWKTGKRKPDFFQMELFAAQVFKHYPEVQRVRSTLIWLKDLQMDSETYLRENSPKLWAKIMEKVGMIESSVKHDNWPAKPSGLCPYCPARSTCDFAR